MLNCAGVKMLNPGDFVRVKKNYISKHDTWLVKWAASYKTPMVVLEANDFSVRVVVTVKPEWLPRPIFKKITFMPQALTRNL